MPIKTLNRPDVSACPWAGGWEVDAAGSSLQVSVKVGLFATARGRFGQVAGTALLADEPTDSAVDVAVTTSSLTSGSATMDALLQGAGIVDCLANPELTFRSTGIRREGDGWALDGLLATAGATVPLALTMAEPTSVGAALQLRLRGALRSADAVRLLSRPGLEGILGRTMHLDLTIVLRRR